jgi:folate-binding protein YgfZ
MLGVRCWLWDVLVAASPRCAVSQVFNLPTVAREQRSADYKSAIQQVKNLRHAKYIRCWQHARSPRPLQGVAPEFIADSMNALELHAFHHTLNARFTEVGGMEAVEQYGDAVAEHTALREAVGLLDLSFRSRLCLTGADRQKFLNGQVTNNVKDLKVGEGCYAALVNAKGRVQSDLNIYVLENEILLDFEPGYFAAVAQRLEKFVIAEDVQVVDVAPHYGLLSVQGPKAGEVFNSLQLFQPTPDPSRPPSRREGGEGNRQIDGGTQISSASGSEFAQAPTKPMNFVSIMHATLGEMYWMNFPRAGASGFDLFVPAASLRAVADELIQAVKAVGGRACGWQALEIARIEAGIPRFGVDMDETNLAPEAGIEQRAISYSKGCYIGQEVIARIRTYGQVAKALRGLQFADSINVFPKRGDKLYQGDKEIGYVTSAVASPALKSVIAMAYVRREHNEIGTELRVRTASGDYTARIVPLPFIHGRA